MDDDPFDPPEGFFLPNEQFSPPDADDASFEFDVLKYFNFSDDEDAEPLLPASPLPLSPLPEHELNQMPPAVDVSAPLPSAHAADAPAPSADAADQPALEDQDAAAKAKRIASGKQPIDMNETTEADMPAVWASADDLDCSCCFVLREVVHSNGSVHMKLALHGGLGVFDHAILDVTYNIEGSSLSNEHLYVELSGRTYSWVKNFLMEYGIQRKQENLVFMYDTMSAFFDVLSVNMNYEEGSTSAATTSNAASVATTSAAAMTSDAAATATSPAATTTSAGAGRSAPMTRAAAATSAAARTSAVTRAAATTCAAADTTSAGNELPVAGELPQSRAGRPPIAKSKNATQRERTKNLTLDDLATYFHLPISEAARMMDLCATAVKKSCRRHGLTRWPHRKIKSIDKMIIALQQELRRARTPEAAMRIRAEIARLRNQRDRLCSGAAP